MPRSEQSKQRKKEYDYKYRDQHLKRIPLDVPKEKYDQIKAAADSVNEPVNTYIKKAIDQRMDSNS